MVSVRIPEQLMELQLLLTAVTPRSLCISRALGTKKIYAVCRGLSYNIAHPGLQPYSVGSYRSSWLCRPCRFSRRKLQITRWWSVVSSALLLTRTSNTDWNGRNQLGLSRYQWVPLTQRVLCTRCICAHLCVERTCSLSWVQCEKKRCGNALPTTRERKTAQTVRIKWPFAYENFHTGSSYFSADFWLTMRICVSLAHLWDRSRVLMLSFGSHIFK